MAFIIRISVDGQSAVVRRIPRKLKRLWIIRNGWKLVVFRFADSVDNRFYTARFRLGQRAGICLPGKFTNAEDFQAKWKKLEGGW
jgi:hypothetical protein